MKETISLNFSKFYQKKIRKSNCKKKLIELYKKMDEDFEQKQTPLQQKIIIELDIIVQDYRIGWLFMVNFMKI